MMRYPVMNVGPVKRMGQVKEFEVLSDIVLARICMAIEDYNNADTSWSSPDVAAAERTQRDSTATVQSVIDGLPAGLKNAAIWEIRKYCPDADAVLDTVRKPGPETPPAIPTGPDVASVDRYIPGSYTPPPPPPPTAPPVASVDRYIPRERPPQPPPQEPAPVATGPTTVPFTTGSEAEPPVEVPTPTPTPTPQPPPMPPSRPPVESPSVGCWYVMGQGYMWGPRPSGGESTGLNQKDCESLMARDIEVRTGQAQVTQQASCDPMRGQFYDPRTGQCRGSVSAVPGIPFDGGGAVATGLTQAAVPTTAATSFMGARHRVALRGVNDRGNIDWWMYQQTFIPDLFFARPRVRRATLGVGKPVPPGVCCQATQDGGAICSTGQGFPPDCPNKPEPNVPGIAQYIEQGGYIVPKPPPAPVNGVCPEPPRAPEEKPKEEGGGIPPLLGIAAVGALIYGLTEIL